MRRFMLIKPTDPSKVKQKMSERPVICFGIGELGRRIAEYCEENDIPIAYFTDNSPEKRNSWKQASVISPETVNAKSQKFNVLIASNIYYDEIKKQVKFLGFSEENIFSYKMFCDENITWTDLEADANWGRMRLRVKQLSEWIDERAQSVVDWGAGEEYLRTLLSPEITYTPVDYIQRTQATVLCDLNDGVFPNIYADVAVLSGLLEFLSTSQSLVAHVCKTTRQQILVSYITLDCFRDVGGRRISGYVNDFLLHEFVDLFVQNGFFLVEQKIDIAHNSDTLFLFEKV